MGHKKKMGSQALSQMRQAGMDLSLALAGCRALACSTLVHEVSRQVYVNVAESRADRSQAQGMCASGQPLGSLTRTILHAPDGTLPGSCLPPDPHLCCPAQILLHHPLVAATSALYCERPADWMRKLVRGLKQNNGRGHVNPSGQPLEA